MNFEKDDLEFLQIVLNQLSNQSEDTTNKINLESYECVEHPEMACKNEKLQRNIMCSVGNCTKIFGGVAHLKHHYKTAHPEAIFEIDFRNEDYI